MSGSTDDRRPAELVASLAGVRARLSEAASAVGRDPWSVTLVAVTKTFPATDVVTLLGLGVSDIAESRDQEARRKLRELADLIAGPASSALTARGSPPLVPPRMHFVGRLQTNKCRSIAGYADCVHTLDRREVVDALADGVKLAGRGPLSVFIQVSLDGDPARGGVSQSEVSALAEHAAARDELRLIGVMAVAPIQADPEQAYERLAEVSASLRQVHPDAVAISAGMSGDFEVAVKHGATHVRIGSALLGRRDGSFG